MKLHAVIKIIWGNNDVFIFVNSIVFLTATLSLAVPKCNLEEVKIYNGLQLKAKFCVEIASSSEERQRGLMFREELGLGDGMMFVYDQPQSVSFWMKNTSIPLDIIFADSNGLILKVIKNAVPFSQASIFGGNNVQYVIEINAGLTEALDIVTGNFIKNILVAPMN